MWIEESLAEECYRAVVCYLSNEEKIADESLHCENVKFAAISRCRDLETQCEDILFGDKIVGDEYTIDRIAIICEALDFCIQSTSHVAAASSRWANVKSAFQKSCPDADIF